MLAQRVPPLPRGTQAGGAIASMCVCMGEKRVVWLRNDELVVGRKAPGGGWVGGVWKKRGNGVHRGRQLAGVAD